MSGKYSYNFSEPATEPVIPETINVDNSNTVLERISRLYADQLMSDVSLIVGGTEYPSHRLILCATSDVFQVMLMKPEWTECGESRVVLQETPECASVFASFLRYFYTGQISITDSKIIPLLSLADKYNVKSLEDICVSYMKNHIALAASQNQLVSWLQYTAATGHHEIATLCHNFIKWNLEMVAHSSDFDNLEPDMLINILQQNDLVVHDELRLYKCVSYWIQAQSARIIEENSNTEEIEQIMQRLVYSVMSYIRFPMMSPRQLADLLLYPLTAKYKEFFVDRFAIGMSFHSNQKDRIRETITSLEEGKLLFQPRLYTSDSWSTLLNVEHFHSLPSYHTSTFVFSSHSTLAEHGADRLCEWVVDLFPKGVWFRKCLLIVWQGTVEVPEHVLRTVRLAVTCKDPPPLEQIPGQGNVYPDMRVKVGILISGVQGGIEHIMTVKERIHHFNMLDRVMNLDDLIPFDELNPPATAAAAAAANNSYVGPECTGSSSSCDVRSGGSSTNPHSLYPHESYLIGTERDELKLHIVISPMTEYFDRKTVTWAQ